jgi:formylglycine-generating enzyme required for sulfatase activity
MLLGSSDPSPELQYLPYVRDIEPFYLLNREVTETEYAAFVEENPYWAKENIDQLLLDGVVDEEYLDQIDLRTPSRRPIRNISQTAASAFCDWYSSKLRSLGYQYEVSLPTEEQWEAAALLYHTDSSYTKRLLIVTQDGNDLFGMMGSVWEFTSSPYIPLANVLYADSSEKPSLSHEIDLSDYIVKGGSFVNTDVFPYTKGVIDKSACSPYIGFRTVIREQKN